MMTDQEIKEIIRRELPEILQTDPAVQRILQELTSQHFAGRWETDGRFEALLEEYRNDRDEQNRKWWENQQALNRFMDEQAEKSAEQDRRWWKNQQEIDRLLTSVEALSLKHDSTIGALGARWGLFAEQSFRDGLRGILQESFGVEVLHVNEFDDEGEVFGRPDQVELDIVIKDGLLIICEIKSSVSKADMHIFGRKARFYEKRHGKEAARRLVISPMVDARAFDLARRLGIEVYSYARDVPVA